MSAFKEDNQRMTMYSSPIHLPGLIDMHVHLRDPGETNKEDFLSGTSAALAGGFTCIFDMPNNAPPITTAAVLDQKVASARRQVVCDVGLYFGSTGENLDEFAVVWDRVWGLKLYLNETTGRCHFDLEQLPEIFMAWKSEKPILLHAEADVIRNALRVASRTRKKVHVCHVSQRAELAPIIRARRSGLDVTCGVTPHHLFLTVDVARQLGEFGKVKPSLKRRSEQDYLWEHLSDIDVIESDHAPHTIADKEKGAFGFPGLESTLPLMLQAEREGKLSREDLVAKLVTGPRRILGLTGEPDTSIEVIPEEFVIGDEGMKSKAAWTPFKGLTGFGRVRRVMLRGVMVYEDGQVLAEPGSGRLV